MWWAQELQLTAKSDIDKISLASNINQIDRMTPVVIDQSKRLNLQGFFNSNQAWDGELR
jgi:hypothetical protein